MSTDMAQPEMESLHDLFHDIKRQKESLISGEDAIRRLETCKDLISRLALFSANEELDDLSTETIQYLAVDYMIADLYIRSYNATREATLRAALGLFESFLERLDQYSVLSRADRELFGRFQEEKSTFRLVTKDNAEERRKSKISRFQEEKVLKAQLQHLKDGPEDVRLDDEKARELYLAELALFVHQSFHSCDTVAQELSILAERSKAPIRDQPAPLDLRSSRREAAGYSERLDDLTDVSRIGVSGRPLLDKAGKPLRPFTLTDQRSQLRRGVFGPDHSLPTMSIDEYLEEERKRGGIIDGGGNENSGSVGVNEDDMDYLDAQTMKAREWDDFVEANPKGAGNTINRG